MLEADSEPRRLGARAEVDSGQGVAHLARRVAAVLRVALTERAVEVAAPDSASAGSSTSTGPPSPTTTEAATTSTADATTTSVMTQADTSTTAEGVCGDGLADGDEECDLGDENSDAGLCTSECVKAFCSDGLLQPANDEECDRDRGGFVAPMRGLDQRHQGLRRASGVAWSGRQHVV